MSFLERMKKRVAAIAETAVSAHLAPEDTRDARMAECNDCEKLIQATMQCRACGCFVKAKTALKDQKCPLGKW